LRKTVSLFVVVLSFMSLFSVTALHATEAQYGVIQGQGHSTVTAPAPQAAKEHQISIAYAQQLTRTLDGGKVASRMLHRVTTPMASQHHVAYSIAQTTSSNWGGYVADTSATGIHVDASFSEFNASRAAGTDTASWVGVGGFHGGNVAQAGIDQSLMESWYEFFPNPPVFLYSVNSGDEMYDLVLRDRSNGLWLVFIEDLTTGVFYTNEFSFNPDQTTAEWIVEVQPNGPVGSFAPVNFTFDQFGDGSSSQPMTSSEASPLWQVSLRSPRGGSVCPSGLTNPGTIGVSFSAAPC
jgi:Peptidase A4 family